MFNSFKHRATEIEIMDDLSMKGELLAQTLEEIELVNRFLGGHQVAINGLKKTIPKIANTNKQPLNIADLGCGGGDTLKAIADWAKKHEISLQLYGIDANAFTLKHAQKNTPASSYPNIHYLQQNIFSSNCSFDGYDIIICSLFLHHFNEAELLQFFQKCHTSKIKALLINDLQRHWLPYYLFKLLTYLLRATPMTKTDGLLSIRKGFTHQELNKIFQQSHVPHYTLKWKWAFRYQAICQFTDFKNV